MTVLVFLGFAMPGFWLALLLMLYTGLEHQWLPISGLMSLDYESLSFWGKLMDLGRHLVLPITVITVGSVAGMSRFMRSSMLEVLRQDFILTAKAKGLPARVVISDMPCAMRSSRSLPCSASPCPALSGAVSSLKPSLPCPAWDSFSTPRSWRGTIL